MKDNLRAWLRQPTTVGGISAVVGTVVAMALMQITWYQAAPLLAGAAMSIILPDDSSAKQRAMDFAARVCSQQGLKSVK